MLSLGKQEAVVLLQMLRRQQQHQVLLQICHYCLCFYPRLAWLLCMIADSGEIIVYCFCIRLSIFQLS